ncbi:MAG: metal-sensitive transcriptional regulator [Bacillota bacterium]
MSDHPGTTERDERKKRELRNRIRRIEGQVRGVERMISEDRYCVDILRQLAAVRSALHSLAMVILSDHVQGCVADAIRGEGKMGAEEAQRELIEVLKTYIK